MISLLNTLTLITIKFLIFFRFIEHFLCLLMKLSIIFLLIWMIKERRYHISVSVVRILGELTHFSHMRIRCMSKQFLPYFYIP